MPGYPVSAILRVARDERAMSVVHQALNQLRTRQVESRLVLQ